MEKKTKPGAIQQLLDYAGDNKKQLYFSTFLATLGELFGMAPFIAVSLLVSGLFNKTATIQNVLILFVVALGGQVLKLWLTYQSSFMSHNQGVEYLKREEIFEYVKNQYGTVPEYLWETSPKSAVLRHKNGKWYAVLMQVEKSRLGLEEESMVDIINVKCEPDMVGLLTQTYGFLSGYHMNKKYWITMLLDGRVSEAKILDFLDLSYDLIDQKKD